MKKLLTIISILTAVTFMASCGNSEPNETPGSIVGEDGIIIWRDGRVDDSIALTGRDDPNGDLRSRAPQLSPILDDEEIAVITTAYGVIYLRFFPDEAPLAVESFLTHSKNGYYDGLTFHRVMEQFMIQGGCPLGTGTGGTTSFGYQIGTEISSNLVHIRGALSMANTGRPNSTGSQFFIVQRSTIGVTETRLRRDSHVTDDDLVAEYLKQGGTFHLDGHHTVFGQVFKGMDVVDRIAAVEKEIPPPGQDASVPVVPVIIESIVIKLYSEIK